MDAAANVARRVKDWNSAAAIYGKLVVLKNDDPQRWYHWAMALLAARNMKAYKAVCEQMISQFGDTSDKVIAERVLYASVYGPLRAPEVNRLRKLLVNTTGTAEKRLRGAVAYRTGNYDLAVESFESFSTRAAWDSFFLALAYRQRNDADRNDLDNAHKYRDEGNQWTPDYEPGWDEQAQIDNIREEIAALIDQ